MKYLLVIIAAIFFNFEGKAQTIPAFSADQIIKQTSSKDTIYIINFWATWCAPCVAELPEFNALKRRYEKWPVRVILVSLDFKEDYPAKLGRFIEMKKLRPDIFWLSDSDPNIFIPKIENSWGGSIPATIIVAPGKGVKKFIEGSVTERQISNIVDKILD